MTKTQARALLRAQRVIHRTLDAYEKTLNAQDKEWANTYWVGRIRRDIDGWGYASAPIAQADEALGTPYPGVS